MYRGPVVPLPNCSSCIFWTCVSCSCVIAECLDGFLLVQWVVCCCLRGGRGSHFSLSIVGGRIHVLVALVGWITVHLWPVVLPELVIRAHLRQLLLVVRQLVWDGRLLAFLLCTFWRLVRECRVACWCPPASAGKQIKLLQHQWPSCQLCFAVFPYFQLLQGWIVGAMSEEVF